MFVIDCAIIIEGVVLFKTTSAKEGSYCLAVRILVE